MKKVRYSDIEPVKSAPGVGNVPDGVTIRDIFGKAEGASFSMRIVEDKPSNELPHGLHIHPWDHQVFVIQGTGIILTENQSVEVHTGDCVFIPANEAHTIGPRDGKESFVFVDCISRI